MVKDNLISILHEVQDITKFFKLEPFDIYILGGSACILGEYTSRATLDVDFVDLGYPAKYGKVFLLLRDYDMLDYQSTILSPNYKERALKLDEFDFLNIYILSKEDVAISKIIRLEQKDIDDLDEIIPKCNKQLLNKIIDEVLKRNDLFESKKKGFKPIALEMISFYIARIVSLICCDIVLFYLMVEICHINDVITKLILQVVVMKEI